jgi:hypothetical protein
MARARSAPPPHSWRKCLNAVASPQGSARSEDCARAMSARTAGQPAKPADSVKRRGLPGPGFAGHSRQRLNDRFAPITYLNRSP